MFRNNIVLRLRSLWRNRTHAAINILGLSLGITSTILIFLVLQFELSFEKFRSDGDRIFRVVCSFAYNERTGYTAAGTYPMVPAIRTDFPDTEFVSLVDMQSAVIRIPRADGSFDKFRESKIVFVDSSYMDIMQQEWVAGNSRALTRPNTVVLTESMARKYFGESDPVNKVINYNSEFDLTVSGVVKDPPLNTDFYFDLYITNDLGATKRGWDNWVATAGNVNCLVKLHDGVTREQLEARMKGWHMKYFTGTKEEHGRNLTYFLQPLDEIHYDTRFWNPAGRVVSPAALTTMGLIGGVLLLTACVNFINLNSVLIIDRSKEAGVRKAMGSTRTQLIYQFLGETVMITLIALLLSSGLVELMLMQLETILGYRLSFHPFADLTTAAYLIIIVLIVTALAGLYPAVRLARFEPVRALKNKIAGEPSKGITLRRSLIVFQLVISQVLIVCTIIAVQQLEHFMKQPLGLDSHAVVEFGVPENGGELMRKLSDRLRTIPGVENFSASNTGAIAGGQWTGEFEATVEGKLIKDGTIIKMADHNYLDTYRIKLLHGENLLPSDTATRFVVNVAFTKVLGLTDPQEAIGISVNLWGRRAVITGVANDFNVSSLHVKIKPTIILCGADSYSTGAVRLRTDNMQKTLNEVRATWEAMFTNHVYEQKFLDDKISSFYDAERRVSYLIGLFAGVAIFIGCIGLFGLVSFMVRSKTKEVGIRKTLGASVAQVIALFSREFMILIGISFAISVPITWYFMNEWLSNFEYRIHPGVATFFFGVAFTCVVVLSTVGVRSYKAATANPVDALRDE